ncbi:MAG: STAS domain-containing protein [Candidatus Eremiobacteraeota bacterium]|nr:STAS domain-containing protein [Candidatus Eremiobacteraeota bacterium]
MEIQKREVLGIAILDLKGEVDIYSSEELKHLLEELSESRESLLLNVSNTDYIDSFGLSLLISFRKKMGKQGKRFGLCCPQSYVRRILNLTKLYDFLSVYESEEKAIEDISRSKAAVAGELEPTISLQSDERS